MIGEQLAFCFTDGEVASELYVDEVLDGSGRLLYLDRVSSVSALPEPELPVWDVHLLEEQHRRFLNEVQSIGDPV